MRSLVSFLVASCALVGCASVEEDRAEPGGGGKADGDFALIPLTVGACADAPAAAYDLHDAKITGNQLVVNVGYSGGCKPHTFQACWDGRFAETAPVQASLRLFHDAHGDACEALKSSTVEIDLTNLALGYREAYQTTTGEVIVKLDDLSERLEIRSLDASALELAFELARGGANYLSEIDSAPTWVKAAYSGEITAQAIRDQLGAQIGLEPGVVMELETGEAVSARLAGWATASPDDEPAVIASAAAFGRIKRLFEANLTNLTFARIGRADAHGGLAVDAGVYQLVVVGHTADGKLAGFFVTSVET